MVCLKASSLLQKYNLMEWLWYHNICLLTEQVSRLGAPGPFGRELFVCDVILQLHVCIFVIPQTFDT